MRQSRRGATLVEFAIVLPIIFLLFFSIISVSRLLMLQHTADTAAYEAARAAMIPGATAGDAVFEADQLLAAAGVNGSAVVVEPSLITQETAFVSVRVDIPVEPNSWILPDQTNNHIVSSEVTLLTERSPVIRLSEIPSIKIKKGKNKNKEDN